MKIEQVEEENMNKLLKERERKIKRVKCFKENKVKTIWKEN